MCVREREIQRKMKWNEIQKGKRDKYDFSHETFVHSLSGEEAKPVAVSQPAQVKSNEHPV